MYCVEWLREPHRQDVRRDLHRVFFPCFFFFETLRPAPHSTKLLLDLTPQTIVDEEAQRNLIAFISRKKKGKALCSFSEIAQLEEYLGEVEDDDNMSFSDFFARNKAGPKGRRVPPAAARTQSPRTQERPGTFIEAPVQPVYASREELAKIPQAVPPAVRFHKVISDLL